MIDITKYPYFSYNPVIDHLMKPLKALADIEMLGFRRMYPNRERFLINYHHDYAIDFYSNELYRFWSFENEPQKLPSAFHMWDHLSHSPPEIFKYCRQKFALAHGLTVFKQHESYSDSFSFATYPSNNMINHFYLNEKELIEEFISAFYEALATDFLCLSHQTFSVKGGIKVHKNPSVQMSTRQKDCGYLVLDGLNAKEIGRTLNISHRTVEAHLNALRIKLDAKNRQQLCVILKDIL